MSYLIALALLIFLVGITAFVFTTRVIIPIYKIYHDQLQIK